MHRKLLQKTLPAVLLLLISCDSDRDALPGTDTDVDSDTDTESSTNVDTTDTGTDTGVDCGVTPVNPDSTATTRRVLCYLHEIYRTSVLSGQQDCAWSSAPGDVGYINEVTGEYPAIVGGDLLYDDALGQAAAQWASGGLPLIRYHMGRPEDPDSYESSLMTTDLADTLTPGTDRYNGLMAKFDYAAGVLGSLKDINVVVLWAPFHEAQPNGWFWWSKGTSDQLKQLWQLMFDNFTAHGLNNLIWVFPFSHTPDPGWFPGAAVTDLGGPDNYSSSQPFVSSYSLALSAVGDDMPIPLHESGNIPNPDDMFNGNAAPWVLFNMWCDELLVDDPVADIQHTYAHERTINRDDLPAFE